MITAVTTCMGRREHLEASLPLMLEEFDDVVMVDWSCPQASGDFASAMGARVVRKFDQKYFSAPKARNLGAKQVKTRSICFIDADTLVNPGTAKQIESLLDLSSMVIAPRRPNNIDVPNLVGFLAVDIGQFWGVNGYNESLTGYGLEDCYLRAQLLLERGLAPKRLSLDALGAIQHSNELRGKYFKEPIEVAGKRNHEILLAYLRGHGIRDWITDPRTADIAYRNQ